MRSMRGTIGRAGLPAGLPAWRAGSHQSDRSGRAGGLDQEMTSFARQRWLGFGLFLICSILIVRLYAMYVSVMPRIDYLSGWALFSLILALTLYNGRKKLPFLPVFSSEAWLQFHIYAGLLTAVLFAIHLGYRVPKGWLQGTLAWLYVLVMLSGFFGLFLSRTIPKRLTTRGGEVFFEEIPALRRQLQARAEVLALKSIPDAGSSIMADFYL